MQKKNVLMMTMSLAMVGVVAVGGTLAYLTSTSGTLTNTFTVGQGYGTDDKAFYLDETKKTEDTNPTAVGVGEAKRTTTGNTYAAVNIGDMIYKDPTFHLPEGPESYIFAYVDGLAELKAGGFIVSGWSEKWEPVEEAGTVAGGDGYYYYKDTISSGESTDPLFTTVTLPDSVTTLPDEEALEEVVIKGVAIQAANIANADAAWDALKDETNAAGFMPAQD